MCMCVLSSDVVFFFKQKTAYEMRISDWSSDVCSSDLGAPACRRPARRALSIPVANVAEPNTVRLVPSGRLKPPALSALVSTHGDLSDLAELESATNERLIAETSGMPELRSEEHTSELQSLMRISYAVFCLKKKK